MGSKISTAEKLDTLNKQTNKKNLLVYYWVLMYMRCLHLTMDQNSNHEGKLLIMI